MLKNLNDITMKLFFYYAHRATAGQEKNLQGNDYLF